MCTYTIFLQKPNAISSTSGRNFLAKLSQLLLLSHSKCLWFANVDASAFCFDRLCMFNLKSVVGNRKQNQASSCTEAAQDAGLHCYFANRTNHLCGVSPSSLVHVLLFTYFCCMWSLWISSKTARLRFGFSCISQKEIRAIEFFVVNSYGTQKCRVCFCIQFGANDSRQIFDQYLIAQRCNNGTFLNIFNNFIDLINDWSTRARHVLSIEISKTERSKWLLCGWFVGSIFIANVMNFFTALSSVIDFFEAIL